MTPGEGQNVNELVMIEGIRLWIQAAEIGFPCRVAGLSLRDGVTSSDIRGGLGVEPLFL